MRTRRQGQQKWLILLGVFVVVFVFSFLVTGYRDNIEVDAVNLGAFDAGYIMSDYQMGNYNAMNEGEIWNFLKQKGNCNDTRTYLADRYTSYSYHIKDGHFVCLAAETFGDGTAYGDAAPHGESAAHIIWQAAQDYRINPQVLIVLLQKEQGLITDSWPNNRQYRSATGYGCPDTAACDSQYYGFKNQVRKAAAMFRTVLDGGWTNYPLGWNYVQYNPNSDCGGDWVNIRSLATSALYRYTPYQPNGAALSAGYDTGDSCSAYGNRNFYLYFEDWFGGITKNDIRRARELESGTYKIVSAVNSDKALTINGTSSNNKVNIQATSAARNTTRERWEIRKYDDYYVIINKATGKVVDVENQQYTDHTNIWQYELNRTCAQRWIFGENSDGTVTIYNACNSEYVLDLERGEVNVQLYSKTNYDNANQKWSLVRVSD